MTNTLRASITKPIMTPSALWFAVSVLGISLTVDWSGRIWPAGIAVWVIMNAVIWYRNYWRKRWLWIVLIALTILQVPLVLATSTFAPAYNLIAWALFFFTDNILVSATIKWVGSRALASADKAALDTELGAS